MAKPKQTRASDPYLSPQEVADTLGISTKTLKRERDRGAFPQPAQLSAVRIGWRKSIVDQIMNARDQSPAARVATQVAASPTQLTIEEVAELLPDLMARYISAQTGNPVDPATLSITRQMTPSELAAHHDAQRSSGFDALRSLNTLDSVVVAYCLLPSMRAIIAPAIEALELPLATLPESELEELFEAVINKKSAPSPERSH